MGRAGKEPNQTGKKLGGRQESISVNKYAFPLYEPAFNKKRKTEFPSLEKETISAHTVRVGSNVTSCQSKKRLLTVAPFHVPPGCQSRTPKTKASIGKLFLVPAKGAKKMKIKKFRTHIPLPTTVAGKNQKWNRHINEFSNLFPMKRRFKMLEPSPSVSAKKRRLNPLGQPGGKNQIRKAENQEYEKCTSLEKKNESLNCASATQAVFNNQKKATLGASVKKARSPEHKRKSSKFKKMNHREFSRVHLQGKAFLFRAMEDMQIAMDALSSDESSTWSDVTEGNEERDTIWDEFTNLKGKLTNSSQVRRPKTTQKWRFPVGICWSLAQDFFRVLAHFRDGRSLYPDNFSYETLDSSIFLIKQFFESWNLNPP